MTFADGKAGRPEIVDDGTSADGKPFPDGKHIVGDDAVLRADGDVITVYYADSTTLGLRRAVGTTQGGTRKWDVRTVPQPGRWVAFPQFVPGEEKVAAWWRQTTRATRTIEGDVLVVTP